jgi:transcription elongation factor GreA
MTRSEHERLRDELDALCDRHRETAVERLAATTDLGGDAAENTEVLEARRELELQEQRIEALRRRLEQAEIVEADAARGVADIGTRVKVDEDDGDEIVEYEIVGSHQGEPARGRVAYDSPIGQALCGHRAGAIVEIDAPTGVRRARIVSVTRPRRRAPDAPPTRRRRRMPGHRGPSPSSGR